MLIYTAMFCNVHSSSSVIPSVFSQLSPLKWSEVTQSCLTLCDHMYCSLPGSSVHGIFPGKNTGMGCHFLPQEIFPAKGLNLGLPHCRQTLYCLSHQGSLCLKKIRLFIWLHLVLTAALGIFIAPYGILCLRHTDSSVAAPRLRGGGLVALQHVAS